jgi:hypothetical protein
MRSRALRHALSILITSVLLGAASKTAAQGGATLGPVQVITLGTARINALSVSVSSGAVQSIAAVQDNAVNSFPTPVVIRTKSTASAWWPTSAPRHRPSRGERCRSPRVAFWGG